MDYIVMILFYTKENTVVSTSELATTLYVHLMPQGCAESTSQRARLLICPSWFWTFLGIPLLNTMQTVLDINFLLDG
ncbi:hypothetical protein XELAEV_18025537mg [Xenopus laevis]|uniref:Uncharacterized protein n=1 Tax=Xenopus laevis TaxID=8355 RepID=A0A974HM67_XENLA|nr:hypothetical protein XELAEV_18025537mg [Xenopus laevis]